LFKSGVGTFLRAYGAYPLNREGRDLEAFLWARRLLEKDKAIVLFPEAHRHPGLGMQKAVPGVALLALRTQAPILPVGITGTGHMEPLWRLAFPTGRITVRIGPPFTLPLIEGRVPRQQLEALADMVMQHIAMLLPSEYRGVYQHSSASLAQEQGNATPR
jgi:1-acyl-sn-glycerol-3-phosphate acyltransferase